MSLERHHGGWVIMMSVILSFMLAVMPLPLWATIWRPEWALMVLSYWCIAIPQRVGVATGWFVGLIHDVLSDTLLGQHALSFCLISYINVKFHRRLRLFPIWQQAVGIGGLIAISGLLNAWIRSMVGHAQLSWSLFYPAVTSMLLWPWIFIILRDMRRTYRVF